MEDYDPVVPSVLTLHSIMMNTDGPLIALFVVRSKEIIWYRIEIDPVIKMVEKYHAALKRKANTIKPTDISTISQSGTPIYGEEFYQKQQMCADTLNFSPVLITRIERRPDIFTFTPKPTVTKFKPTMALNRVDIRQENNQLNDSPLPVLPTNQSSNSTSMTSALFNQSSSSFQPASSSSKPASSSSKPASSSAKPASSSV
ncbi:unnamed protein product [Mytilus coruscus]|uniref:Uncharacterized protein n=1 Tax=Mytilus coruscus TaxID=42192 RepID=A0A6J7ZWW2_MYTCO|nr:unnamed protein product [Mytilus coruscus]